MNTYTQQKNEEDKKVQAHLENLSDDELMTILDNMWEGLSVDEKERNEFFKDREKMIEELVENYNPFNTYLNKTKVIVERTEARRTSVTYRTERELSEIRENNDISWIDVSDEELIEKIEDDPSSYLELFEGEIIYDKTKDMGIYDEVTIEEE